MGLVVLKNSGNAPCIICHSSKLISGSTSNTSSPIGYLDVFLPTACEEESISIEFQRERKFLSTSEYSEWDCIFLAHVSRLKTVCYAHSSLDIFPESIQHSLFRFT